MAAVGLVSVGMGALGARHGGVVSQVNVNVNVNGSFELSTSKADGTGTQTKTE